MSSPTWGDPLWGDSAFADPGTGASSTGGGIGSAPGVPHLYARISITAVIVGSSSAAAGNGCPALVECIFYDSGGTQISTSGGTASSNGDFNPFVLGGGTPASAFDGNSATSWCVNTTVASPSSPVWLQMQFATPVSVDHFSLTFANLTPGLCPANFSLQVSDDGSAWTTVYSYLGGLRVGGSYTNTFYTSGTVYRLSVTAVQSGSQATFSNIKFFDGSSTLITGVLGKGFASTWDGGVTSDGADAIQGYNQTCSNWFTTSGTPSSGSPEWVAFQFPAGTAAPESLSFQTGNHILGPANAPVVFSLQSSTDGANFTTLQTYTAATWTTTCQTQTFSIGATGNSITINPSQGFDGSTYSITVIGTGTHFVDGVTAVTISGAGATISNVVVSSTISLTFTLALAANAVIGARTVTTATGSEAPTALFTILPLVVTGRKRGDIGWSQIREGLDGIWGFGPYGVATDGSFLSGDIPVVGPDGTTLIGSGTGIAFLGGGGGAITVNGSATVQINGVDTSFDSTTLVNGA